MRIFVTGGTGAIGGYVVPTLVRDGHEVSALARTAQKAAALSRQGAKPTLISIFDRSALESAFTGHDAVVNLASAIPPMTQFMRARAWRDNQRVRIKGSTAVVDAALAAGVGRVVQESVAMLYPDSGSRWIDEDVLIDRYPIALANIAAEENARRFSDSGCVGLVLRFGWFYGPGAAHSEQMLAQARHHIGMILGPPGGYVSSIHLEDAASAILAALQAPAGIYNVVDDEPLTKRQYADALAAAAGRPTWLRGPGRAALLLGESAAEWATADPLLTVPLGLVHLGCHACCVRGPRHDRRAVHDAPVFPGRPRD
jgi:nucleoside-diphosphate-sugar epimerase